MARFNAGKDDAPAQREGRKQRIAQVARRSGLVICNSEMPTPGGGSRRAFTLGFPQGMSVCPVAPTMRNATLGEIAQFLGGGFE